MKKLYLSLILLVLLSLTSLAQDAPFPTEHLQLWLRADSVELTDGKVSRWYDLSPNQYEIVQTNANARPTINESAINNLPALQFNGTSTYLDGGNILNIGQEGWTYLIVAKRNTYEFTNYFFSKGSRNNGWNSNGYNWYVGDTSLFMCPNTLFSSNGGHPGEYSIYGYELFNRTTLKSKFFLNGLCHQVANINDRNISNNINFYIGGHHFHSTNAPNGYYLNGEIAEIIAFDVIDSTLSIQINEYLTSKYSATVSIGRDIHTLCDTTISAYMPDFISYQWSTGETDSAIHVSQPGSYSVTVTNSFGVTSTDDINVYFPEVYQMQNTTICVDDTIYWDTGLDADGYAFQWMKDGIQYANVSNRIEIFEAGAYTCVITDSLGCSFQTDTVHITIDDYPISTSFCRDVMHYVSDTALCSGNTLGLATNIDETTSYLWNTGATSSRITLTESGDYSLTTTNSQGCRAVNSIHVNILGEAPEINYAIDNLCFGDSTSFIGNAQSQQGIESYLWIIDSTDSISAQNFNYEFATIGNHNIRIVVTSNNSCRNDSSFNITIKEIARPGFTFTPICYGVPMEFIDNSSIPGGTTIEEYSWMIGDSIVGTEENLTYTFNNSPLSDAEASVVNLTHSILLSNGCSSSSTLEVSAHSEYSEPHFVSPAYPTNGMLVSTDSITFLWNYDYDILYYNLITSSSADFTDADTIACSSNRITLSSENFVDTTYWKVASYNHCLLSFESEPYFFHKTIGNIAISSNPNLQLWLRADSVELTDGKVSRWYDLSLNNYEIVQTNANARPTINVSAINNLPALQFNGTSTFLNGGNILNIGTDGWTYYIVAKQHNDTYKYYIGKGSRNNGWGTSGNNWFLGNNSLIMCPQFIEYYDNGGMNGIYGIFGYELFNRTDNSINLYTNGINTLNITYPVSNVINNNDYLIGGKHHTSNNAPGGYFLNGEIAEIIAFNTIDSTLRNRVYDYLYCKYVATVSLGLDIHTSSFCDTAITTAYNPNFVSYLWSTGETDSIIHVSQPGTYSVTVTNNFGVTSSDKINVYFPEVYQLQDTTICAGDSIVWNLKLNPDDYTIEWYNGQIQDQVRNDGSVLLYNSGRYFCNITDTLGCTFTTDTVTVLIDDYPNTTGFAHADTILCAGNRLRIENNFEETTTFQWNTGNTEPEIAMANNGTYSVTTSNAIGCSAQSTINVSLHGQVPNPYISVEGHCQNSPLTFADISTSMQGEINTRHWFINDTLISDDEIINHSFELYGDQEIRLYINTTDNCHNDTTITIHIDPQPKPEIWPKFFCQNTETEIHATPSVYEGEITENYWEINGEYNSGNSITTVFSTTGMLPISLTSTSATGCSGTSTILVNVIESEPAAISIDKSCIGHETTFTNKTPFSSYNPQIAWTWTIDSTGTETENTSRTFDTAGLYAVTFSVKYANQCTASLDTIVEIHPQPEVTITSHDLCIGNSLPLAADIVSSDEIAQYNWQLSDILSSNSISPEFTPDTTGNFPIKLSIETLHHCKAEVSDTIRIHERPEASFTNSRDWGGRPLYISFENTSVGAESYIWDFAGQGSSTQASPYFIFNEVGTFNVKLTATSQYGCSSSFTSNAITVVEPIVDIMLMDLKIDNNNGFASVSFTIINLGTLHSDEILLELNVNGRILRETIDHMAPGEVLPHTFGATMPIPTTYTLCVTAIVPDVEGTPESNLENNTLCHSSATGLTATMPYPSPASDFVTCEIHTPYPTEVTVSIFNSFGELIRNDRYDNINGYHKYIADVSQLSAGLYFIRIMTQDEKITQKFEVQR